GQRGDGGGAVAIRGFLAARGGAHGLGHPAGGQPDRGAARGHRRRRRPGHAGEDEELAAVLRRLYHSPAERAALADRGLRRVGERFAWPAVAQATVGQYLAAMERLAIRSARTTRKGQAEC